MRMSLAINSGSELIKDLTPAIIKLCLPFNVTNLSEVACRSILYLITRGAFKNSFSIWWFLMLSQMHKRNCRLEILDM